jgi:hypothetical protein
MIPLAKLSCARRMIHRERAAICISSAAPTPQTRYSGFKTIWTPLSVATFLVVSIKAALLAAVCSAIGLLRLCK